MNEPPGYLDTLGLWEAAAGMPEQLVRARGRRPPTPSTALGPSERAAVRIGRRVRAGHGRDGRARPPLRSPQAACRCRSGVGHGPEVPAFVDAHTLVFAVSMLGRHRGDAARPRAEASARGARRRGRRRRRRRCAGPPRRGRRARVVAQRPAGSARWAGAARGAPRARAAAGRCHRAAAGRAGPDRPRRPTARRPSRRPRPRWRAGATPRWRRASAAQALARRIGRTIPLVYGSSGAERRGGSLVEGPGQPQRQGAGLRRRGAPS